MDVIIVGAEEAVIALAGLLADEDIFAPLHLCAGLFDGVPSGLASISLQQSWLGR